MQHFLVYLGKTKLPYEAAALYHELYRRAGIHSIHTVFISFIFIVWSCRFNNVTPMKHSVHRYLAADWVVIPLCICFCLHASPVCSAVLQPSTYVQSCRDAAAFVPIKCFWIESTERRMGGTDMRAMKKRGLQAGVIISHLSLSGYNLSISFRWGSITTQSRP